MRILVTALTLAGAAVTAVPAAAQFSDSHTFLKAVRDKDVLKAKSISSQPGSAVVNFRDPSTGDTPLILVTRRRDGPWMNFLIGEGADINGRDREGNTAIIVAASLGFTDGVRVLVARKANVDAANSRGETALIKAVQARDPITTRVLLEAGANPDLTDNIAGLSARDYAAADRRAGALLRLIDEASKAKPTSGTVGPSPSGD